MPFDLGDYQDVAARMADVREKHPEASFQPADPDCPYRIEQIDGQTFVVYVAACYRTPDDPRPGIGSAWEPFPGKTSYTKDSELQNAETSAWGRAAVAALAADTKKVSSRDEVQNRRRDQEAPTEHLPPDVDPEAIEEVKATFAALDDEQQGRFSSWRSQQDFSWPWTVHDCALMLDELARIISVDAVDLAGGPCQLCGSTRARRVLDAHGRVRCANANDCRKRAAQLEAPFVEAGTPPSAASTAGEPAGLGSSPGSPALLSEVF
jgi:hypothetical protein